MMSRKEQRRSDEGTALVLAIGYVGIVTLLASALLVQFHRTRDALVRAGADQQCFNLAESGIDKAVAELRAAPDGGYRGEQDIPFGKGRFSVAVEPGERPRSFRIRATGAIGGYEDMPPYTKTSYALLELSPNGNVTAFRYSEARLR